MVANWAVVGLVGLIRLLQKEMQLTQMQYRLLYDSWVLRVLTSTDNMKRCPHLARGTKLADYANRAGSPNKRLRGDNRGALGYIGTRACPTCPTSWCLSIGHELRRLYKDKAEHYQQFAIGQ